MFKKFLLLIALFFYIAGAGAQEKEAEDHSYKPLKLNLNESGSKYIRFLLWNQLWLTNTSDNPGTLDIDGKPISSSTDFAIRRARLLMVAQVSSRFMLLTHVGINNQNFSSGGSAGTLGSGSSGSGQGGKRPQLYVHDVWGDFAVVPSKLNIGAGLHYWNGVSRLTNASTITQMTLDAPIFNWPNIEATDQFARQLGIFAHGQLGKLDYRFSVNKPFAFGVPASSVTSTSAKNILAQTWSNQGYFFYQIFDKESTSLPYMAGTYFGAKKILNVGAGYYSQAKVTANIKSATDTTVVKNNELIWGVDVFGELPLNKDKGSAINFYAVAYGMDFGPNYIRNIGVLNPNPGVQSLADNPNTSWAGGGNAQPTIGSGTIIYTQVGYLAPKFNNGAALMPYVTYTNKNFQAIEQTSSQFDLGLNYFISGHNAKLTAQYGTRPVFKTDPTSLKPVLNGSKGEFVLQMQVFL